MANMCYMIVTPDLEDAAGISAIPPNVPNPPKQYMIKFGDGDPYAQGRYDTHNPSYSVNVNRTGRIAGTFEQRVFATRGFHQSHRSREWYIVWERTPVPGPLRAPLLQLLADWVDINMGDPVQVTAFIDRAIVVIPAICRNPVGN